MTQRLKDKVAIITGAGRGLGQAYALRFAGEGAKVAIPDIIFENAQKVVKEIEAKGGQALALHTDVSDETSTQEMARKTVEGFGKIDVLVNNAALFYRTPVETLTIEDWERVMDVNLTAQPGCSAADHP